VAIKKLITNNLFDLNGKTILFTGGYGHLGKYSVLELSKHGAKVFVLARSKDKFNKEFKSSNIIFQECDISETDSIKNAFKSVSEKVKTLDVLINNAAYTTGRNPELLSDEEWSIGLDGVVGSAYRCIREIIPYFKKQKKGTIINVASMYGVVAPNFDIYKNHNQFMSQPNYGTAKAGMIQLTKYFSSYLGKLGINVNTISPGPFPELKVQQHVNFINSLKKQTLLKRIGYPEDLSGVFVFLSSDASRFITGQNIIVDGGWTSK
jgi:NAD(P)-dependent dehydrogenase (short-subunit alcohol dehydrogenase family)